LPSLLEQLGGLPKQGRAGGDAVILEGSEKGKATARKFSLTKVARKYTLSNTEKKVMSKIICLQNDQEEEIYLKVRANGKHPKKKVRSLINKVKEFCDSSARAKAIGKVGDITISNQEFVAAVFRDVPEDAFVATAIQLKPGMGNIMVAEGTGPVDLASPATNNFVQCCSFHGDEDGPVGSKDELFAGCHVLLLNRLNRDALLKSLNRLPLSWLMETMPGCFEGGIILSEPITDREAAEELRDAIIEAGLCEADVPPPWSWAHLPVGTNRKSEMSMSADGPFSCRLLDWRPDRRYTPLEIVECLKLNVPSLANSLAL
jgi:hypothetical protein